MRRLLDPDVASVSLGDGFNDGEAEAGAGGSFFLLTAAIELVEDALAFFRRNAGAVVGDANDGEGGLGDGGDGDGGSGRSVAGGILQQVAEQSGDGVGVGEDGDF